MKVCHVVPGLHPQAGGPSRTVVQLTDALAAHSDVSVTLVSQGQAGEPQVPSRNINVSRQVGQWRWRIAGSLGLPGRRNLLSTLAHTSPELIHIHAIWHPLSHWASQAARNRRVPVVLHPRGMLEPWALEWRGWKKKLALWAYQGRDLDRANVLIATAEQEAEGFRRFGLRQPIAILPNGIEAISASNTGYTKGGSGETIQRRALFLGRIHPIKGLFNLLDAWADLSPPGWELALAGPDEGGHLAEIRQRISELGLQDQVQYLGSIDDRQKGVVYRSADLFILPSFSENFGVVVAEALSHGLPVITTTGTPWQGLQEHNCGWWVAPTKESLFAALREATSKQRSELMPMGLRAQDYAREFDWSSIARQTLDVYRWLVGQSGRPGCVYFD